MNRIVTMVLKNLWHVPGLWFKLCNYAKHTDDYPEAEKWRHIQRILRLAIQGGNVDLQVTGLENIPTDEAFMMYANHQGMFDVLAIAATCDVPLGAVLEGTLRCSLSAPDRGLHQVLCYGPGGCASVFDRHPKCDGRSEKRQKLSDLPGGYPQQAGQPDAGIPWRQFPLCHQEQVCHPAGCTD